LRHRLRTGGFPQAVVDEVVELLSQAETALGERRLPDSEGALLGAESRLDRLEEETELTEFPRGLVEYVARGPRGSPPPREEEPLANRMLIVERLWEVRRADGFPVEPLLKDLRDAERAYGAGDRGLARRLVDRVHTALEAFGEPSDRVGRGDA
jgi:hypothetical protein